MGWLTKWLHNGLGGSISKHAPFSPENLYEQARKSNANAKQAQRQREAADAFAQYSADVNAAVDANSQIAAEAQRRRIGRLGVASTVLGAAGSPLGTTYVPGAAAVTQPTSGAPAAGYLPPSALPTMLQFPW